MKVGVILHQKVIQYYSTKNTLFLDPINEKLKIQCVEKPAGFNRF